MFAILFLLLSLTRALYVLARPINRNGNKQAIRSKRTTPCALAIFLGSGGHTSEALSLISDLDFSRYSPRTYIISEGDTLSATKARELELQKAGDPHAYRVLVIPRARQVHQPLITTPLTTSYALLYCVYYITLVPLWALLHGSPASLQSDVLILNGPGTCFVLAAAVYLNKFFGLSAPKIIYVETFARVRALSLSGKLLHYLADSGLVAYPLVREVTVLVGWSKALPLSLTTLLESGRVSFPRVMMARTRDVLSVLPPLPKEAS